MDFFKKNAAGDTYPQVLKRELKDISLINLAAFIAAVSLCTALVAPVAATVYKSALEPDFINDKNRLVALVNNQPAPEHVEKSLSQAYEEVSVPEVMKGGAIAGALAFLLLFSCILAQDSLKAWKESDPSLPAPHP